MKSSKLFIICLYIILAISACAGPTKPIAVQPIGVLPSGSDGYSWWNDTTFYEIFVRSYFDSNGDGIGDFNGITQKLDYLNDGDPKTTTDLGVTGIWLMPINPSPSYHGYDVSDYYAVNPDYGTLDDFKKLISEAHKRGIRVIMDMVMNHTSNQNPWFKAALDPNSPYRDWYIWSDTNPGYKGPWGEDVWYRTDSGYYYAIFADTMPDLNYKNPAVIAEMEKVTSFWLKDIGVDGFRLDAAKHIVEEGQTQENSNLNHAWWQQFRTFYKGVKPDALTVGEVWSSTQAVVAYLKGDQLDMAFDFDLAKAILYNVTNRDVRGMRNSIDQSVNGFSAGSYAIFLTNHDMPRTMTMLMEDPNRAKTAATLLLTLPGVPFIYYGEEIGMTGQKPDPRLRTPMQWSADSQAGFTTGTAWEDLNPNYTNFNVALQTSDPTSLLSVYRSLIQLRNQHVALRIGQYTPIDSDNRFLLSYIRFTKTETVLVIVNLGKDPVTGYQLTLSKGPLAGNYQVVSLLNEEKFTAPQINPQGGFDTYQPILEIPANGCVILQLQAKK